MRHKKDGGVVTGSGIPTLTTERLVLRPFDRGDLDDLVEIHAEPSFWWYPLRGPMSPEQTALFLDRVMQRYENDGFGVEALVERESGRLIGWAGLAVPHFLPQILPAVEVGWRLAGPYRGRGLATEAGAAAVDFGFGEAGLERIVSIYETENERSGLVMERLGFTLWEAGIATDSGELVSVMELHRAEWERRTSRG
jgi:RimJ/RimL family protein N-acetyltransferase